MTAPNHYHDRIQRATRQLAQLQVRELLASQRRDSKAKAKAKRDEIRRRARVAELVFLSGTEALEDTELLGALLLHQERRKDPGQIRSAKDAGIAHIRTRIMQGDQHQFSQLNRSGSTQSTTSTPQSPA
jgi:hypothetical protein